MCVCRRLGADASNVDDDGDGNGDAHLREQQAVELQAAELDTDPLAR